MCVSIGGEEAGRINIGLFGKIVPETTENFAQLGISNSNIITWFYRRKQT